MKAKKIVCNVVMAVVDDMKYYSQSHLFSVLSYVTFKETNTQTNTLVVCLYAVYTVIPFVALCAHRFPIPHNTENRKNEKCSWFLPKVTSSTKKIIYIFTSI